MKNVKELFNRQVVKNILDKSAIVVFFYHRMILIGVTGIYYFLGGFDGWEVTITTSFIGILLEYTKPIYGFVRKNNIKDEFLNTFTYCYFSLMLILLTLKAVAPNVMNFNNLLAGIIVTEYSFSILLGNIEKGFLNKKDSQT